MCRWLVPFALAGAALTNAMLAPRSSRYGATLAAQLAFYAAAAAGASTGLRAFRLPAFFVSTNVAVPTAWLRYVRGERITTWNPSERLAALPRTSPR